MVLVRVHLIFQSGALIGFRGKVQDCIGGLRNVHTVDNIRSSVATFDGDDRAGAVDIAR